MFSYSFLLTSFMSWSNERENIPEPNCSWVSCDTDSAGATFSLPLPPSSAPKDHRASDPDTLPTDSFPPLNHMAPGCVCVCEKD